MGSVVCRIQKILIQPVFNVLLSVFALVIDFIESAGRMICDTVFGQSQLEFSSEQDQNQTRQLIEEQRRKKAGHRRKMTCKCCNKRLVDYTFDCGDMACQECNDTRFAHECFFCKEIIRKRAYMGYNRSALL